VPSLPPSIPHPLKDEDTDEDMEDAEIEEKSKESSLHRAATRSSKKRTAEDSGRIIVLSEKEGYISHEKGANGIDFKEAPWNDDKNLLVWVENPRDVPSAFAYFLIN